MEKKRKNLKINVLVSFFVTLVIIVVLNVIFSSVFRRFDLTSDKRYTLSEKTKETLRNLDDYVYFKVYLEGEFPAQFKKMRRDIKEMLDEFRVYSKYIDYEFINPNEGSDVAEINEGHEILKKAGLVPYEYDEKKSDGSFMHMRLWPGVIISYHNDTEVAVNLLGDQNIQSSEDAFYNLLEYHLIDGIKRATRPYKPSIAFIEGHGELSALDVHDITKTLEKKYHVTRGELDGKVDALLERSEDSKGNIKAYTKFDAIVIAKPTEPFDEKDKFLIDQYIMHGGKVLWLVEPVYATMDSLTSQASTMGVDMDLNLDDMLFKYGVRLKRNLLLDMKSAPVPLIVGWVGDQPQFEFFKWFYFPLVRAASDHLLVRNLDGIKLDFVSSIEPTTSEGNIKKTPLLETSEYTKESSTPVFISLDIVKQKPDKQMFPLPSQDVAYLLEGKFQSLYANRIPTEISESNEMDFITESVPTSMIVVADGDIIRNQIDIKTKRALPLGFDQYSGNLYGNSVFIENAIDYLLDGDVWKTFEMRLLDENKINKQRLLWQLVNTIVPTVLVILFGVVMALIRKHKYSKTTKTKTKDSCFIG